jgi:hypothetical protein
MYATMMLLPFKMGYTLRRWETVPQTMLEKIEGNPGIDKLWVIQIEADLNMNLRIKMGAITSTEQREKTIYHLLNGDLALIDHRWTIFS